MSIIISENGKNAKRVEESNFALEDRLQQYIYDNPEAIPIYDIEQDTRLFIAAREFNTRSGPIDALGFDASGNIYVVETKLFKNPDKRTVVAQALDYGASLWRHATDFDDFFAQLDAHCMKQFSQTFNDKYNEFFQIESTSEAIDSIKSNLADGRIKFVVLMDKLHAALKDLVVFVNQNSKFDLYAVELEYYKHQSFEIIIPKLYGAEVKKEVTSSASSKYNRRPLTKEELLGRLNDDEKNIALAFINAASSENKIGISWRKTGFSIWTMIPQNITQGVYDYEAGYSYIFFQASEKSGHITKTISFWYPESSYESLPKLRASVEKYRRTYTEIGAYDSTKKEIPLSQLSHAEAIEMVDSILASAKILSALDSDHIQDKYYRN